MNYEAKQLIESVIFLYFCNSMKKLSNDNPTK